MSLLSDYLREKNLVEIVESEKGFATFYFLNEGCYVQDIFVSAEFRHQGIATKMLDEISNIARTKGYKKLFGSCVPSSDNSTSSLIAAFDYGFKLHSSKDNFILYIKDII